MCHFRGWLSLDGRDSKHDLVLTPLGTLLLEIGRADREIGRQIAKWYIGVHSVVRNVVSRSLRSTKLS